MLFDLKTIDGEFFVNILNEQAQSKVDFIETMWQKTSRRQSPSA